VPEDAADLLLRFRQRDHHRNLAVRGQPVALVGLDVLAIEQNRGARQERLQRSDDFALAREVNGDLFGDDRHAGILANRTGGR